MDMSPWKKILLQWIIECNYVGKDHTSIEQANVEDFFNAYVGNLQNKATPVRKKQTLLSFLESHYTDFTPLSGENGAICLSEYVYVYSLLLHYSCVEIPHEQFQNICKKLPGESQKCIAAFLAQVVESPVLTREFLRQACINVSNNPRMHSTPESHPSSADNNSIGELSLSSTGSSQASDVERSSKLSSFRSQLVSTPVRQLSAEHGSSPSTPKTVMLENRTRELYSLRAALETERYDKGMLEMTIKQKEEDIVALNNEKKTLQLQLKELKQRNLACQDCESEMDSCQNDRNQIEKRLKKEINQKENEIATLADNLRDLKEEKLAKEEKLKSAEKQISLCLEKIDDLEHQVEQLLKDVNEKDNAIRCLNNYNDELQQFIAETKRANKNKSADLNTSTDCFNNSFTPSSTSGGSPENLGYVIDKQLREKEHENENLVEQLMVATNRQLQFEEKLKALVKQKAEVYHLEIECGKQNEGDADELLTLIVQCIDLLGTNYISETRNVSQLQDEINMLTSTNDKLNSQLMSMENEVEVLRSANHVFTIEILQFNKQANINQQLIETLKEQLTNNDNEIKLLKSENAKLRSDADFAHQQNEGQQKQLSNELEKHKEYIMQKDEKLAELNALLDDNDEKFITLDSKVHELTHQNVKLEELNKSLKIAHATELQEIKEQLNENLKYKLMVESQKGQIADYITQISHVKEEMEQIKNSHSEQVQNHSSELAKLNELIFDLTNEKNDLSKKLATAMEEFEKDNKDKQKFIATLNERAEDFLKIIEAKKVENAELLKRATDAEAVANNCESKLQIAKDTASQLQGDFEATLSEYRMLKTKFETISNESSRLCSDMADLRAMNQSVHDELKMKNDYARNADEKIKELLQQIDKLCLEKDALNSETKLLHEQIKAIQNDEISSAVKLKELKDNVQENKRKSLNLENEIKAIRLEHDKLKSEFERTQEELNKQRELNVSLTKRLERASVNLGEAQAKALQMQRKNAEHVSTIDIKNTIVTTLQRERDSLQIKIKSLDERLLKSERSVEMWSSRAHTAETTNRSLQELRAGTENMLVDCRERNKKLENVRLNQDETIRQLTATIDDSENKIVQLTLEVGGLNSQLIDIKAQLNERNQLIESLNAKYDAAQQNLTSIQAEATRLREQKELFEKKYHNAMHKMSLHNVRLTRSSDELQHMRTERDGCNALCDQLCATNHELRRSNTQLCNELAAIKANSFTDSDMNLTNKLENDDNLQTQIDHYEQERKERELAIEMLHKDLNENKTAIEEQQAVVLSLHTQIGDYKQELSEKQLMIEKLHAEVEKNKASVAYYASEMKEMREAKESLLATYIEQVNSLQKELHDSDEKLLKLQSVLSKSASSETGGDTTSNTDDESSSLLLQRDRVIAQLRLDNQVLQAKYRDAKGRIAEESKLSEERVKEQRLELEGKLEKMKTKMKVLYTEEITKMKAKQEREIAAIKEQYDHVQAQNKKYEEHTRKLSSQIVRLNDKLLEQQKQNTILSTKLKHAEETQETMSLPSMQYKRIGTITTAPPQAVNLGTNLAMEDEEGEIFNNTYLTDLKTGRMPEITAEELQYRNSLLPPHLKSAYAAQYDLDAHEDDIKDGPHSLDDSMSALLSTTNCPIRKKSCGTHYKRPGPPTPSKHGGRLSFGGNSEPPREILKESYDGGNAPSSGGTSVKTPSRFGFLPRFSLGSSSNSNNAAGGGHVGASSGLQNQNTRDEQKKHNNNLLRRVQRRNMPALQRIKADATGSGGKIAFCTSTPRKSRIYYDQRRLINYSATSSASTPTETASGSSKNKNNNKYATTNNNNSSTTTPLGIPELSCIGGGGGGQYRRHAPNRSLARVSIMQRRRHVSVSGKKFSPQVRRLTNEMFLSATTSSGDDDDAAVAAAPPALTGDQMQEQQQQQEQTQHHSSYRRRRRQQTRTHGVARPRPSLYIHGYIFAKPWRAVTGQRKLQQQHSVQREQFRAKARNQRFDNFDQCRHLTSLDYTIDDYEDANSKLQESNDIVDELAVKNSFGKVEVAAVTNATYDLRNNNYSYDDLNKWVSSNADVKNDENNLGTTMVIVSHEKATLPPDVLRVENVSSGSNASTALADTFNVCNDDNDVLNDNEILWKLRNRSEHVSANVKQFEQMIWKADNTWLRPPTAADAATPTKQRPQNDASLDDGAEPDFVQMCQEIASNAPFAINPVRYDDEYRLTSADADEDKADDQNQDHVDVLLHAECARKNHIDALLAIDNNNDPLRMSLNVEKCNNDISNNNSKNNSNNNSKNNTSTLLSSCCSNENSQKTNPNQHNTTNASASSTHSHTVYPAHNLFDRRLPIINVTPVPSRKSAESSVEGQTVTVGGIFAANATNCLQDASKQTITAADLARMWHRMDTTARSIVGSAAFAMVALCISIVYILKQDTNAE